MKAFTNFITSIRFIFYKVNTIYMNMVQIDIRMLVEILWIYWRGFAYLLWSLFKINWKFNLNFINQKHFSVMDKIPDKM